MADPLVNLLENTMFDREQSPMGFTSLGGQQQQQEPSLRDIFLQQQKEILGEVATQPQGDSYFQRLFDRQPNAPIQRTIPKTFLEAPLEVSERLAQQTGASIPAGLLGVGTLLYGTLRDLTLPIDHARGYNLDQKPRGWDYNLRLAVDAIHDVQRKFGPERDKDNSGQPLAPGTQTLERGLELALKGLQYGGDKLTQGLVNLGMNPDAAAGVSTAAETAVLILSPMITKRAVRIASEGGGVGRTTRRAARNFMNAVDEQMQNGNVRDMQHAVDLFRRSPHVRAVENYVRNNRNKRMGEREAAQMREQLDEFRRNNPDLDPRLFEEYRRIFESEGIFEGTADPTIPTSTTRQLGPGRTEPIVTPPPEPTAPVAPSASPRPPVINLPPSSQPLQPSVVAEASPGLQPGRAFEGEEPILEEVEDTVVEETSSGPTEFSVPEKVGRRGAFTGDNAFSTRASAERARRRMKEEGEKYEVVPVEEGGNSRTPHILQRRTAGDIADSEARGNLTPTTEPDVDSLLDEFNDPTIESLLDQPIEAPRQGTPPSQSEEPPSRALTTIERAESTGASAAEGARIFHSSDEPLEAVQGVVFDPRVRNRIGNKPRQEIIADAQRIYQDVRNRVNPETGQRFTHEEAIQLEELQFYDRLVQVRDKVASDLGVSRDGPLPNIEDTRRIYMQRSIDEGVPYSEVRVNAQGIPIVREMPVEAVRAELGLDQGHNYEPSDLQPDELNALAFEKSQTELGVDALELAEAIEIGDESILERVHPHRRTQVEEMYRVQRRGIDTNEPRSAMDVLGDIIDLVASFVRNERGSINFNPRTALTHNQRMIINRLVADAEKFGEGIGRLMRRAGVFRENQISLVEAYLASSYDPKQRAPLAGGKYVPSNSSGRPTFDITDQVIEFEQRVTGRNVRQPRFDLDIKALYEARELSERVPVIQYGITTNPRMLEEAGLREPFQYAYRAAVQNANEAKSEFSTELRRRLRGISREGKIQITAHGYNRTREGRALNQQRGITLRPLTAREQGFLDWLDRTNATHFEDANLVRLAIGVDPIQPIDNYFTHMRVWTWLDRIGDSGNTNFGTPNANSFMDKYNANKSTTFPNEKVRKGGFYEAEYDVGKIALAYHTKILDHIHISPFVSRVRELIIRPLPDPQTGEYTWNLSVEKPRLFRALRNWSNHISGRENLDEWVGAAKPWMQTLDQNMVYAYLSWNLRSALIQPTSLINTITEIGLNYTGKGANAILSDALGLTSNRIDPSRTNLQFMMDTSDLMMFRNADVLIDQTAKGLEAFMTEIGDNWESLRDDFIQARDAQTSQGAAMKILDAYFSAQKLGGDMGMGLLKLLDFQAAAATWHGAYRRGLDIGLDSAGAKHLADDVVTRTQGSALGGDIAPAQRYQLGKSGLLFQTYALNEFGFIWRDVMGMNKNVPPDPRTMPKDGWKKAVRLLAWTLLANQLIESELNPMRANSPRPRPIKSFMEGIQAGGIGWGLFSLMFEFADLIPGIQQMSKYGEVPAPVALAAITEVFKTVNQLPGAQHPARVAGTVLGVPATSQVFRTINAQKRGQNWFESLFGWYDRGERRTDGSSGRSGRGGR